MIVVVERNNFGVILIGLAKRVWYFSLTTRETTEEILALRKAIRFTMD